MAIHKKKNKNKGHKKINYDKIIKKIQKKVDKKVDGLWDKFEKKKKK